MVDTQRHAEVVELVDTLDLKSNGHYGRAGSSPAFSTDEKKPGRKTWFFCFDDFMKLVSIEGGKTKKNCHAVDRLLL
jgi:hypothetical protein